MFSTVHGWTSLDWIDLSKVRVLHICLNHVYELIRGQSVCALGLVTANYSLADEYDQYLVSPYSRKPAA